MEEEAAEEGEVVEEGDVTYCNLRESPKSLTELSLSRLFMGQPRFVGEIASRPGSVRRIWLTGGIGTMIIIGGGRSAQSRWCSRRGKGRTSCSGAEKGRDGLSRLDYRI